MDRYQAALEALALQEVPQYAETARAFGVDASNLLKRWRGKTGLRAEYINNIIQSLLAAPRSSHGHMTHTTT